MKILVAHASNYDYRTELYEPLRQSVSDTEHTVIFPNDENDSAIDTNIHVSEADLLIAEISHPSVGAGIEIGLAQAANVPTLFLCKEAVQPSSALDFIKGTLIRYADTADLTAQVKKHLA